MLINKLDFLICHDHKESKIELFVHNYMYLQLFFSKLKLIFLKKSKVPLIIHKKWAFPLIQDCSWKIVKKWNAVQEKKKKYHTSVDDPESFSGFLSAGTKLPAQ